MNSFISIRIMAIKTTTCTDTFLSPILIKSHLTFLQNQKSEFDFFSLETLHVIPLPFLRIILHELLNSEKQQEMLVGFFVVNVVKNLMPILFVFNNKIIHSLHMQQVINGLRRIGHNITMSASAGSIVQGILQLEEGKITANADYRKRGVPDGY